NYETGWQVTALLKGHFALLLAVVLLTGSYALPSAVRAECGDYVLRGDSALSNQALPRAMAPSKSAQLEQQLPMSHGSPRKPCHGPQCSKGTASPSLPPTTVPPSAEQWGCIAPSASVRDCLSTGRISEDSSQPPRLFAQGIYHPPRSSSSLRLSS